MKRILIAMMLVLGFSASAKADGRTLFLTCNESGDLVQASRYIINFDKKDITVLGKKRILYIQQSLQIILSNIHIRVLEVQFLGKL